MLIVISPAKNLAETTPLPKITPSQPELLDQAEQLIQRLKPLAPHELSALMGISDALGQLNYDRYQAWQRPFTTDNARPAVLTFNGDVYQGLNAAAFKARDFTFAQKHLRILSGLYGVLRPLDLMQPYRLEMGTRLNNAQGKDLYAFWGNTITEALNRQVAKSGAQQLVNLASNEYFKAVRKSKLAVPVVTPVFKEQKNGQYKVISFYAKKARGQMSAYIIKNRLTSAEQLREFDWENYQYNPAMSAEHQPVFTRDQNP